MIYSIDPDDDIYSTDPDEAEDEDQSGYWGTPAAISFVPDDLPDDDLDEVIVSDRITPDNFDAAWDTFFGS